MLSACSSNDDYTAENVENNGREAIKIGVSSIAAQVGTRGTGTVGGVYDGETEITANNWAGQKINVYMFNKGTLDITKVGTDALYDNAEMTTPENTNTGEAYLTDKEYKYYPATGAFDFWGYRLDGANGTNVPAVDATDDTKMTVDFTIDGTQDVMRAKAAYTAPESGYPGNVTEDDIYSAKAARQSIQPELVFNHLLTRFTFQIKGGNENSCPKVVAGEDDSETIDATAAVTIKSIELTSRTNGTLLVAHTGDAPETGYITWKEDETSSADPDAEADGVTTADGKFLPYLKLMQRATKEVADPENEGSTITVPDENAELVAMEDAVPNVWKDGACEAKTVGEALLVSPELDEYTIRVKVEQKVLKHEIEEGVDATEEDYRVKENVIELPIRPADVVKGDTTGIDKFLAGTSYNVIVTVYGYERIVISTTLTPWQDGGDINVGQD